MAEQAGSLLDTIADDLLQGGVGAWLPGADEAAKAAKKKPLAAAAGAASKKQRVG